MDRVVDLRAFRTAQGGGPDWSNEPIESDGPDLFGGSGEFGGSGGQPGQVEPRRREPCVSLYDLIPRDFTLTEEIVHGLLMVREVLSCVLPGQGAWRGPLLTLFDAAHHRQSPDDPDFLRKLQGFKNFLERFITLENARDLGTAVVILTLISRSPAERRPRVQS